MRSNVRDDMARYAKILMRLPSLRSWCLKGIENCLYTEAANYLDDILVASMTQ
jgi:hypothetical protein